MRITDESWIDNSLKMSEEQISNNNHYQMTISYPFLSLSPPSTHVPFLCQHPHPHPRTHSVKTTKKEMSQCICFAFFPFMPIKHDSVEWLVMFFRFLIAPYSFFFFSSSLACVKFAFEWMIKYRSFGKDEVISIVLERTAD